MSRKPAFSLAYTHERAFAAQMAQAFTAPAGMPPSMQAILDQLEAPRAEAQRPLADRLDAIKQLMEAEAGDDRPAAPTR